MFRFTIRDMLWLMLLVAVIAAWIHDHDVMHDRYIIIPDEDEARRELSVGQKLEIEVLDSGEVTRQIVPSAAISN